MRADVFCLGSKFEIFLIGFCKVFKTWDLDWIHRLLAPQNLEFKDLIGKILRMQHLVVLAVRRRFTESIMKLLNPGMLLCCGPNNPLQGVWGIPPSHFSNNLRKILIA
jgi:hypothetical protein